MAIDNSHFRSIRKMIDNDRDNYRPSTTPIPSSRYSSKNIDPDIRIEVLLNENNELNSKYAVLLKKTNIVVDAYRKLKQENEILKIKKDKRESWEKNVSNLKKYMKDSIEKIITWFNS